MKQSLTIFLLMLSCVVSLAQSEEVRTVHFSEADGYMQSRVSHVMQDEQGFVWLCTWNGLYRYDGYRFQTYKMLPGDNSPLRMNRFATAKELPDHNLECTTTDSLTFVFYRDRGEFVRTEGDYSQRPRPYKADSATVARVKSLPAFADMNIRILLIDRQDGIWVDTHSGLYRIWFASKPLRPEKASSLAEEEVCALYVDQQQRLWVADKNGYLRVGGLYLSPQGTFSETPVVFGQNVYCVFEDSEGDIWLGAKPTGLTRLTPKGKGAFAVRRFVHDDHDRYSLSCDNVYQIAEDAQQRLWIATYKGGLNMYDLRSRHDVFLHSGNGLVGWPKDKEASKMHCLYITPQQVLVAGTLDGIYTCSLQGEPQQMKFYHSCRKGDDPQSLSNNWVMDIQPAGDQTIAVATSGGGVSFTSTEQLLRDDIRFHHFMSDQGLASDVCMQLYYHNTGDLYIVSQTAISRFSMKDSTITNYIRGTLAEHFNFLEARPVVTADGLLRFGTTQGVLSISTGMLQKSSYTPNIVFEDPLLSSMRGTGGRLHLSPSERSLTIRFSALDFNKNVPITYAYRIDGMTGQWTYITDNQITLPDIPAGTYQLHLRSTNGEGVWADNERTLTIHRQAAFTETAWFWMLIGLLLTLLVIGICQIVRYIHQLQNEIKDIRLTSNERLEVMSERIRELLPIRESIEKIEVVEDIENEEDRLFADHAKRFVEEHLSDSDLNIADFAQEMAISRTVLFARMKSVFGTSPNNYILNQRIEFAKQQLRKPNAYIADIAYRCGFSDPKYFSKCFKKLTGQTPTEYSNGSVA